MKVLLLIPVWKRPRITQMCFEGVCRLMASVPHIQIIPWIVGSEAEMAALATGYHFNYSHAPNNPVGWKLNTGLRDASALEWDYLLQLGSDNILRPDYFAHAMPLVMQGKKMIGLNKLYIYDLNTFQAIIVSSQSMTFGAGRMIHRSLLEACGWDVFPKADRVLDLRSEERIFEMTRIGPTQIPTIEKPLLIDVKNGEGIHGFDEFKGQAVSPLEIEVLFPELIPFRHYERFRNVTIA